MTTVAWRAFLDETAVKLSDAGVADPTAEARWLLEEVSGLDGADWILHGDEPATQRGVARLDALVARRVAGEPIQYVLGRWSFRTLDLLCDRRVLIPRPETEQVVDHVLRVLDGRPGPALVVDLGTGSGAIALSVAVERPGTEVWGVDASPDALAVARANLGGLGMSGAQVRLVTGSWYEPLPAELRGNVDLVVSNPPYVAAGERLDTSVVDWEPHEALVSGPTGLEDHEHILAEAPAWLSVGGAVVLEIGSGQGDAVAELARAAGLDPVTVHRDHAGHPRCVVALRG